MSAYEQEAMEQSRLQATRHEKVSLLHEKRGMRFLIFLTMDQSWVVHEIKQPWLERQ